MFVILTCVSVTLDLTFLVVETIKIEIRWFLYIIISLN